VGSKGARRGRDVPLGRGRGIIRLLLCPIENIREMSVYCPRSRSYHCGLYRDICRHREEGILRRER
jgi:hypothetical protein